MPRPTTALPIGGQASAFGALWSFHPPASIKCEDQMVVRRTGILPPHTLETWGKQAFLMGKQFAALGFYWRVIAVRKKKQELVVSYQGRVV